MGGRVGGRRSVQSITDDDGHYSDIHAIIPGHGGAGDRSSDYVHYIDIDQVNADSGDGGQPTSDPGGGDQAARSQGYEGLDPSVLATLRQPQRPHSYAGLADGQQAAAASTTEEIEMTARDNGNTVSR